jgi:putative FmdB family regulatory protein
MPTYDYQCEQCGHNMEVFQSMSDVSLTLCPQCKKEGLRRLVGGGLGVIFKGSGFYVNDSKAGKSTTSKPAATPPTRKAKILNNGRIS